MRIEVFDRQRKHRVSGAALARFLRAVVKRVPPGRADEMTVCLASDARLRALNREFRGVDRPTDVLSFPSTVGGDPDPEPDGRRYLGDLVISVAAAHRQARERGHSLARELKILCLHGYLHLLGHDHEEDDGEMMRLQARLVREFLPPRSRREAR